MRFSQLVTRGLTYYWRTNLAVVLGVTTAVAVLAGALLVGDSVRASLRDLLVQRLGQTTFVITSNTFFRDQLAADIQTDPQFVATGFKAACPLITLDGTVTHDKSKRVASQIKVYGVDERFWTFNGRQGQAPSSRGVFISQTLASELGTTNGDSLLLQVEKPSAIPLETLHSRKEALGKILRLNLADVLAPEALGDFSIQPQQSGVRAIFVSLQTLQRELEQQAKANLLLISANNNDSNSTLRQSLVGLLRNRITLDDLGITLRALSQDDPTAYSLEHQSKIISESLARIAIETAEKSSIHHSAFFSYLANSIGFQGKSVPYSLVSAIDPTEFQKLISLAGDSSKTVETSDTPLILNEWAAQDLGVRVGDPLTLEYYLWQEGGRLVTKTATFRLAAVVPIKGLAADRDLVPEYPGITGSENISDWDPPFPIDLKQIRKKDEDYWHQYRTTPKGFIPLKAGQELWQTRFGQVTSIRLMPDASQDQNKIAEFRKSLRQNLDPGLMGVAVVPVRATGLEASRGATDFGEYFLYFSFFLVVSALLLAVLFFKLGIEQRIREVGMLRAVGFGPGKIRKLFLIEGLLIAVIGSMAGIAGAIIYGKLMMFGLRTLWLGAVGTTALQLHVSVQSLLIGAGGGIVAALACVAFTLRGLRKQSTRSLLSGELASIPTGKRRSRIMSSLNLAILITLLAVLLIIGAAVHLLGQVVGFFVGGTLLLIALLIFQSSWLRRRHKKLLAGQGWIVITRLGIRNATYRPARSILCIALIASAAFIIVSVDSFRHRGEAATMDRHSGTGGFPLLADSLLPLVQDPNSAQGQEALNLTTDAGTPLTGVTLTRFRVQPGDDASCLNLYQPRNPKIMGATSDFINSNRFVFQSSLASTSEEQKNPWLLLNREFADKAIPVIADANSMTYVLHLKLGDDLVIQHGGEPIRIRVVAALSDSLFQSELLMSEKNFIKAFPDNQGYRFFLIDLPRADRSPEIVALLEDRLSDFGFDVQSTSERLENFHSVENTYLSTFQMLGGLGLVLGTIGLAAVLLRNILERRRELALMRAVGYNSRHFTIMIISENALLLLAGVVTGAFCALLAITPVIISRQGELSNYSLGVLLLAVLASGLIASVVATAVAIRTPLLSALKAE